MRHVTVSRSQAPGLASSGPSEHQQRRAPEVEALGWPSLLTPRPAVHEALRPLSPYGHRSSGMTCLRKLG
ncbi:unnamed protein product [Arctogadus glacialis]